MQIPKIWTSVFALRFKMATDLSVLKAAGMKALCYGEGWADIHLNWSGFSDALKGKKSKGRAKKHLVFTACLSVAPNFLIVISTKPQS